MANPSSTSLQQGRCDEAEALELQATQTRMIEPGAGHADTLARMENLASTYRILGRWDEAVSLEMQALQGRRAKLGDDCRDTLTSLANLALMYTSQGWGGEAEAPYTSNLGTAELADARWPGTWPSSCRYIGAWAFGPRPRCSLRGQWRFAAGPSSKQPITQTRRPAAAWPTRRRRTQAEKLQVQAAETRKAKLGADLKDMLACMDRLASMYRSQGRWDMAGKLEAEVLEARRLALGAHHADTRATMINLARAIREQGNYDEAEALYVQALEDLLGLRKASLGAGSRGDANQHDQSGVGVREAGPAGRFRQAAGIGAGGAQGQVRSSSRS